MEQVFEDKYQAALNKRKQAEEELVEIENQFVDKLLSDITRCTLSDELKAEITSLSVNKNRFTAKFKGGFAIYGDENDLYFTVDDERYEVRAFFCQKPGYVFKHKLKRVREVVNRLLPFGMELSRNYRKMDPLEVRKNVQKILKR